MAKARDVCGGSAPSPSRTAGSLRAREPRPAILGGVFATGLSKIGLVLVVGTGLAAAGCRRAKPADAPTGALLKVEMGTSAKLDPESALRCFVHGQFVGMQTPAQCAEKNGVPAGALDVGLDQSGSLAAGAGDAHLAPIANTVDDNATSDADAGDGPSAPSPPPMTPAPSAGAPAVLAADGATGDCLRYLRGAWQGAGDGVPLSVCVRTLFAGRCVGPGQTLYGRWGRETVRLMPGRVEMSDNNHDFRPLVAQNASDCSLPPL
jgi:hypothetical protein